MLASLPGSLLTGGASTGAERQRLDVELADVRELLSAALSAGVDRDFLHALNALARNRDRIERAFVVWVDLIEVLVQEQEQRYGSRAGLGELKLAERNVGFALHFLTTQKSGELEPPHCSVHF